MCVFQLNTCGYLRLFHLLGQCRSKYVAILRDRAKNKINI